MGDLWWHQVKILYDQVTQFLEDNRERDRIERLRWAEQELYFEQQCKLLKDQILEESLKKEQQKQLEEEAFVEDAKEVDLVDAKVEEGVALEEENDYEAHEELEKVAEFSSLEFMVVQILNEEGVREFDPSFLIVEVHHNKIRGRIFSKKGSLHHVAWVQGLKSKLLILLSLFNLWVWLILQVGLAFLAILVNGVWSCLAHKQLAEKCPSRCRSLSCFRSV